ncbi:MAG: ABC transporter substrate-binding protein [Thermotogota bacterium]
MKKQLLMLFLIALLMVLTFGTDKVLVYISGPEKMVSKIENVFEEKYGDLIDVFHTGSGPLQQKVWTEMMAGTIQADIIWGAEPLMYFSLMEAGVLHRYYPQHYDTLYDELKIGNGYFTATSIRYGTIIVNRNMLPEENLPTSWSDLKRPIYTNKITMANASQSAMAFALFAGLSEVDGGKDILHSMGQNSVFVTRMNMDAISLVQSGDKAICIAPSDGAYRLMKSQKSKELDPVLEIRWPKEGAFLIQRPIALVNKKRSEEQLKIAKQFMDFSLSEECQKLSAQFGFETVRQDLDYVLFEDAKRMSVDWEEIWKNRDEILDNYSQWLM